MHIHGLPNGAAGRTCDVQQKNATRDVPSGEEQKSTDPAIRTDAEHSMSFLRLAEELNRIPEIREQLVARASERYASGFYLTQEAAERTADRMTEI
mgnify:CR=1 FL=1